jgi:hypothetical protein
MATVSEHAQYNDTMNAWTLRTYYPKANGFYGAGVYSLGGMPCCTGGGNTTVGYFADSNAYNETVNVWSSRTALPAPVRGEGLGGFALNNQGYVCGGYTGVGAANLSSVYQYQDGVRDYRVRVALPSSGFFGGVVISRRGNFPLAISRANGFNLNGFGYSAGGTVLSGSWVTVNNTYKYSESMDTWVSRNNLLLAVGGSPVFVLNGLGYVCGGGLLSGTWTVQSAVMFYNDSVDSWVSGTLDKARWGGSGFVLNGYGYVAGGRAPILSSIDRYNDSLNSWLLACNMATGRDGRVFVLDGFSYICPGTNGTVMVSYLSKFNDSGNYETLIAGSLLWDSGSTFSLRGYGYYFCGSINSAAASSVYQYNPSVYWLLKGWASNLGNVWHGFAVNNFGCVVGGDDGTNPQPSVWSVCDQDSYVRVAATLKIED